MRCKVGDPLQFTAAKRLGRAFTWNSSKSWIHERMETFHTLSIEPTLMRIGILGLLHESNTFISKPTTLTHFQEDLLVEGQDLLKALGSSHHEMGGFIQGLAEAAKQQPIEVVPLIAARATPSGTIEAITFQRLVQRILSSLEHHHPLDGLLVAAHGAAVAESHSDADGFWLQQVRNLMGANKPIVATLDPHANLSPSMVDACSAFIAYRTNPHLDQKQRGLEAARLMLDTLNGKVQPVMSAQFPSLVINIERQSSSEPHLQRQFEFADQQRTQPKVLSNSIFLGFPYSDVAEMGAATLVVTDNDLPLAQRLALQLSDNLWKHRSDFIGQLVPVSQAIDQCLDKPNQRICLLDMGDNVGGGSAADGTVIAQALTERNLGPACVCIFDPRAVDQCVRVGEGATCPLSMGGHTDHLHGSPLELKVRVLSFHSGEFCEPLPRHGGITEFDQGRSAVVQAIDHPMTILLTSKRMVPFSLRQLTSCGIDPTSYRILVAKGVHAPLAAYREVCDAFIRVNTPGATCADLTQLHFQNRRRPLFPLEQF